jgi:hypothetical protein
MTSSHAIFTLCPNPDVHDPVFLLTVNGNPTGEQTRAARDLVMQRVDWDECKRLFEMTSGDVATHLTVRLADEGHDAHVTRVPNIGAILTTRQMNTLLDTP